MLGLRILKESRDQAADSLTLGIEFISLPPPLSSVQGSGLVANLRTTTLQKCAGGSRKARIQGASTLCLTQL